MFARRLIRGSFSFPVIAGPPFILSGPYDPGFSPSGTLLTQVHCHTTQSDGTYTPAQMVTNYLSRGYDALMLSDHDKVTAQPAGISVAITGNELSPSTQHIIAMNTTYTRGAVTDAQAIISAVAATGGLTEIAHPKWIRGVSQVELATLNGYSGFEIHNAHVVTGAAQNPVTYAGYAIDWWDAELSAGRRTRWGFAVDDYHVADNYHIHDIGRLRVFAASPSVASIASSIANGNFVADVSNYGVTPGYPVRDDDGVSLTCTGATAIEAYGTGGSLLDSATGTSLSYAWTGEERYVRLVAVGQYAETFTSALDDRWRADGGTWTVSGGTLQLAGDSTARRMLLRRHRDGDFELTVDVKPSAVSTDDRIQIMFNVLSTDYAYVLHIGRSSTSGYNNTFCAGVLSGGAFLTPFATTPFTPTAGTWYRIHMRYTASSGTVQANIYDRSGAEPGGWMISGSSTTWRNGAFGFRATRTPEFDNLTIDGFRTYYQPIAVDLA